MKQGTIEHMKRKLRCGAAMLCLLLAAGGGCMTAAAEQAASTEETAASEAETAVPAEKTVSVSEGAESGEETTDGTASATIAGTDAVRYLTEKYERDYKQVVYTSEDGLEGSAANCVFSASDGMLWVGCYTGLFRYDSHEFRTYPIEEFTVSVNCIIEDANGMLWIGTNGNGIYRFDGKEFVHCEMVGGELLSNTVSELQICPKGGLYAATKSGLFLIDTQEEQPQAKECTGTEELDIRHLLIRSCGSLVLTARNGRAYTLKDDVCTELVLTDGSESSYSIRCAAECEQEERLLLGTNGAVLLEISEDGSILREMSTDGLYSFNQIRISEDGTYWICSDQGIGKLVNHELFALSLPLNNSVENMCVDYQGDFWFASSKQGLLQLYEMQFSNLRTYLGLEEPINSILPVGDKRYFGTDNGLRCFEGKTELKDDVLVHICRGQRIRHIYQDSDGELWISAGRAGLVHQEQSGRVSIFNAANSGLATSGVRFVKELRDKTILIGTESGVFVVRKATYAGEKRAEKASGSENAAEMIVPLLKDESALNSDRILSIDEGPEGAIFIGTDGDGLFVVAEQKIVQHLSTDDGLLSNIILKLVFSEEEDGLWAVSGSGISFLRNNEEIRTITELPAANCLDLIQIGDGKVAVLAGNGMFCVKEQNLLGEEDIRFDFYDREHDLPIDFTANASNIVSSGVLYLCGTDGAATLNLTREHPEKEIRVFINDLSADGTNVPIVEGMAALDDDVYRLNLDLELLNFSHSSYQVRYQMEGSDETETYLSPEKMGPVSYTNLRGGSYRYHFEVLDAEQEKVLAEQEIRIRKKLSFWEETRTRLTLAGAALALLAAAVFEIIRRRESIMQAEYRHRLRKQKQEEQVRTAFLDPVTGVYNRSLYDKDKEQLDMDQLHAMVIVSLNHAEYLRNKKGLIYVEDLLRGMVDSIRKVSGDEIRIYRLSEFIFCYYWMQPVNLEQHIQDLTGAFDELTKQDEEDPGMSIGAVYKDQLMQESYRELFARCDNMRRMDRKHNEAKFMRRKISFLDDLKSEDGNPEKEQEKE
ncbi:MAG: two-component regulator propeller domain-containing protein [Lachnospiraceae bacterium]|nr:two-component regulator propeller domain-containing protein [Lachnospiraceae bacterium]